MGHHCDGTNLKNHAIKTNNLVIKPIVTGCYATAFVTLLSGIAISAVGTLPYAAASLPVSLTAAMVGGTCIVALVAAHIFSTIKKNSFQKNLKEFMELVGHEWNEVNLNLSWSELKTVGNQFTSLKTPEDFSQQQGAQASTEKITRILELIQAIDSDVLDPDMPIKYVVGWQANKTRNIVGYLFAGVGTLALTVTSVFLRIFIL